MKKALIIIGVVLLVAIVGCVGYFISTRNSLVRSFQTVESQWSNVETQYQRRYDLIPNLESTVKGYAQHESSTFEAVTQARSSVGSIKIDAADLNEQTLAKFQQAQNQLSGALKSLLAVSEAYPELKANENFMRFQDELAGTENRIQVARRDYNEAAREYNTKVSLFPANIVAAISGFEKKPYFQSAAGAEQAPKVSF